MNILLFLHPHRHIGKVSKNHFCKIQYFIMNVWGHRERERTVEMCQSRLSYFKEQCLSSLGASEEETVSVKTSSRSFLTNHGQMLCALKCCSAHKTKSFEQVQAAPVITSAGIRNKSKVRRKKAIWLCSCTVVLKYM